MPIELENVVSQLAQNIQDIPDAHLDRPWAWMGYDEGVRFALLRTIEQLYDLAASLETQRNTGVPLTQAQRLLGQYHAAYRDMQAVLIGVDDLLAEKSPSEAEWALRATLLHIVGADGAFFAITHYAIERERAKDGRPLAMSDETWNAFWTGDPYGQIEKSGRYSEIMRYYDRLHQRVLLQLSDIAPHELSTPVVFWEDQPMPVSFRIGRFGSHLRQHTIQMEKALVALDSPPNEARRLLRRVYAALASVESALIGASDLGSAQRQTLAAELDARFNEIQSILTD